MTIDLQALWRIRTEAREAIAKMGRHTMPDTQKHMYKIIEIVNEALDNPAGYVVESEGTATKEADNNG